MTRWPIKAVLAAWVALFILGMAVKLRLDLEDVDTLTETERLHTIDTAAMNLPVEKLFPLMGRGPKQ